MDVPACQGMSKFPSNVPNTSYGRSRSEHSILEWIALGGAMPVLIPVPSGEQLSPKNVAIETISLLHFSRRLLQS